MPKQFTGTMMQILAEKKIIIFGKGSITDKLEEEAGRLRTALGAQEENMKVGRDYVSINCGAYSVGLQIHSSGSVLISGSEERPYIITAEGLTKNGEPLPKVSETLQRLGYAPKSGSPVPVDALSLL